MESPTKNKRTTRITVNPDNFKIHKAEFTVEQC